jgi:hypothetical protein
MIAEARSYRVWRGEGMNWQGEVLRSPIDEDGGLWLAALGDWVAVIGGQLEVAAVFPDETVTLLIEPGL